jgi:hypothetical protein
MICIAAMSTYLAFPNAHYTFDSVAGGILLYQWKLLGRLGSLFQGYHILFLPTIALGDAIASRTLGAIDPLALTQMVNSVFAAASLWVFFRVARLVGLDVARALIAMVLFGGGFAWGFYATNGEPYPISIFFLLLAVRSAIVSRGEGSWKRSIAAGFWLALAVGEHGSCLVAIPGLATWLLASSWDRKGAERIAAFMMTALVCIALPYVIRIALEPRTGTPSVVATTAAMFAREQGWQPVPRVLVEWKGLIDAAVPRAWPDIPTSIPVFVGITHRLLAMATLLPLVLLVGPRAEDRLAVWGLANWFSCTFVFFSLYFPGYDKFTQYSWLPLSLLVLLATKSPRLPAAVQRAATIALGATALFVCLSSADRIRIWGDEARNPYLSRARAVGSISEAQDLVIHLGTGADQFQSVYVRYFSQRRVLALRPLFDRERGPGKDFELLAANVASLSASAHRVVLLSGVFERNAAARAFEAEVGIPEGSLHEFFASYHPTSCGEDPAGGHLWCFDPQATK